MISINSAPANIEEFNDTPVQPLAMSDCIKFCLTPDAADVFATTGLRPKVVIVVPLSCTVPSNGTAFKIWGHAFTVDNSTPFSSSSVKIETNGIFTALNIGNMIQSNIFFSRAVTVSAAVVLGSIHVTIQWNECREQTSFSGANMDLAVFTTMGGSGTATNGTSPEYIDGYKIILRPVRWVDATSVVYPLAAFSGVEVEKLCDEAGETCVTINADIANDLYTLLPDLTTSSATTSIDCGRSMMRYYSLEYGWTYRESCVAKSGTIKKSGKVLCLNAAFDIDDPYGMRRYWPGHPAGLPPGMIVVDYLSKAPKLQYLSRDSYKWLWLLNNYKEDYPSYDLVARWVLYDSNGTLIQIVDDVVMDSATMGSSPYQPICFNASPGRISAELGVSPTVAASVDTYEIQVVGTNATDHEDILFNASEYLKFKIVSACSDKTDVYFLNPCGGIDTMVVRIDLVEVQQNAGSEIQVMVDCSTGRGDRLKYGGRTAVNIRSYTKINFSAQIQSPAHEGWMQQLRSSPQRWIKVIDESGTPIAKKILMESGAVKLKETGFGVIAEFSGYLQDINVQVGTEKIIL